MENGVGRRMKRCKIQKESGEPGRSCWGSAKRVVGLAQVHGQREVSRWGKRWARMAEGSWARRVLETTLITTLETLRRLEALTRSNSR